MAQLLLFVFGFALGAMIYFEPSSAKKISADSTPSAGLFSAAESASTQPTEVSEQAKADDPIDEIVDIAGERAETRQDKLETLSFLQRLSSQRALTKDSRTYAQRTRKHNTSPAVSESLKTSKGVKPMSAAPDGMISIPIPRPGAPHRTILVPTDLDDGDCDRIGVILRAVAKTLQQSQQ